MVDKNKIRIVAFHFRTKSFYTVTLWHVWSYVMVTTVVSVIIFQYKFYNLAAILLSALYVFTINAIGCISIY